MATGTQQFVIKLLADVSQFAKGLDVAEQHVSKFDRAADKLKGIGNKATIGLTLPLLAVGGAASNAASDLNESLSKANVVFGRSGREIAAWSRTAAKSMGLARQEALEAAGSFGNMFRTVGFVEPEAAKMSKTMVQLAADMGSFNNIDPREMLDKLRSGLAGEAEPLRRFGVLLSESAVAAKALEMGLVGPNEKLTEAQKVQARYALILEQSTLQQGDFARTAEGAANSQRIATAAAKDAAAELGEKLLPAKVKILEALAKMADLYAALPEPAQTATAVMLGVGVVIGPLARVAGSVLGLIGHFQTLHTTAATANATMTASGTAAAGAAPGAFALAGGLAAAAAAGVGLGIGLNRLLEKHFPEFNRELERFGGWIYDRGIPALNAFGGALFDVFANKVERIKGLIRTGLNASLVLPLNTVIEAFNRWVIPVLNLIPGVDIDPLRKIPQLAHGGIVTKPTLALIGEKGPEAVVPLSRSGGMGTMNVTININGAGGDPQTLAIRVRDELLRLQRRNVSTALA